MAELPPVEAESEGPVAADLFAPKLRRPPRLPRRSRQIGEIHACGPDCVHLSVTDMQYMKLVAEGLENAQIAMRLGVRPYTVRNRLYTLYAKVGVKSRTELAALALRAGLLH